MTPVRPPASHRVQGAALKALAQRCELGVGHPDALPHPLEEILLERVGRGTEDPTLRQVATTLLAGWPTDPPLSSASPC